MANGTHSADATSATLAPPNPTSTIQRSSLRRSSESKSHTAPRPNTSNSHRNAHLFPPRAPSPSAINRRHVPTSAELVELRAAQRTFEGAYVRTALGQFSFALIVLKIFTSEFYPVGALFAVYGVGILVVAGVRRKEGRRQFFREEDDGGDELNEVGQRGSERDHAGEYRFNHRRKFRTSGNVVVFVTALSIAAYISLMVLVLRMT